MSAILINGTEISREIRESVSAKAAELAAAGRRVKLVAVLVGDNSSAQIYAQRQGDTCRAVGIEYELVTLPAGASAEDVAQVIRRLNDDAAINGIMIHLPLPAGLNAMELQALIEPHKDVEGVNPANLGYIVCGHPLNAPCTAQACIELIKSTNVPARGAEAVVIGASPIVGQPVASLLIEQRATVTLCRSTTRDLKFHTSRADILVVATGKPGMITAEHVREGSVVIDVGINRITLADGAKKTVGDVDFDSVKEKAGFLTPVPGGVGPVTVAILLRNTLRAAQPHGQ